MDMVKATSQIPIKDCTYCNPRGSLANWLFEFTRCPRAPALQNSQRNSVVLLGHR